MNQLTESILMYLLLATIASANITNQSCPVTPQEPAESYITTEYKGQTIGFCCQSCRRKFNANPEKYISNLQLTVLDTKKGDSIQEKIVSHEVAHNDDSTHAKPSPHENIVEHDHSTDHTSNRDSFLNRLFVFIGKLHVLFIHLPIALLTISGALEWVGYFKNKSTWIFAARINFILGASFAVIAAILGWVAARHSHYSGDLHAILNWHRWLGTTVAAVSVTGLVAIIAEYLKYKWGKPMFRVCLCITFVLIPITAHFGGSLIYGSNYLAF